jgi:hypothetical protein
LSNTHQRNTSDKEACTSWSYFSMEPRKRGFFRLSPPTHLEQQNNLCAGARLAVACNGQGATTGGVATVGLATWLDKVVATIGVQLLAMTVF